MAACIPSSPGVLAAARILVDPADPATTGRAKRSQARMTLSETRSATLQTRGLLHRRRPRPTGNRLGKDRTDHHPQPGDSGPYETLYRGYCDL